MYSAIQHLAQSSAQGPGSGPVWEMAGVVAAAGAFGGLVNALLNSGNGFSIQLPRRGTNDVLQLGTVGNIVLGITAALVSWGLYGPLRDAALIQAGPAAGSQAPTTTSAAQLTAGLTITAVIGAIVAGAGGARVISNELDKKLLRDAGAGAAQQAANPQLAVDIATLAPAKALEAAKNTGGSPASLAEPGGAAPSQPAGASVPG